MAGIFSESELPEYHGLGEVPEDLRNVGAESIPMPRSAGVFESDGYTPPFSGGSTTLNPAPPPNAPSSIIVSSLPRQNYESFRSQRFRINGFSPVGGIAPSSGTIFTTIASRLIPGGFAGVLTGLGQFIADASAYDKVNGTPDDITWRITVGGTPAFDYGNLNQKISDLDQECKLYVIITENTLVELAVTNSIISGSFGARNIAVSGFLTGYQFPMDELDDSFRNR